MTVSTRPPERLLFADALCARFCHDFASPIGTLLGSLELMAEDPDAIADALPLASEVAAAMGARLRLLRAAWAGDCGPMGAEQLAKLATGLPGRVRVDLAGLQGSFEGPVARLLLNVILLSVEALPRGGRVALSGAPDAEVMVTLDGPHAGWPANLALALTDLASVDLDNPRAVQPPLVVMLAQAAGMRVSLLMSPAGVPDSPAPLLLAPG